MFVLKKRSTIRLISTKQTTASHLKLLNKGKEKNMMTYADGYLSYDLEQAQKCGWVKLVNQIQILYFLVIGSPLTIQI
jgi:hypothetical protein